MRAKRTPWATTRIDNREVKINLVAWKQKGGRQLDGETTVDLENNLLIIDIDATLIDDKEYFQETLIHELIHLIEFVFDEEFTRPQPEGCSHHASLVGRYLPGLLRGLRPA